MPTKTMQETEEKVRDFLTQELGKEWGSSIGLEEVFTLDSLDQVDLRVFLEESFSVQIAPGQKPFQNLQTILEFLSTASIPK